MSDAANPSTDERDALLLFERLTELDRASPIRADLLAATSPEIRTIVAELEAAAGRAEARLATGFPIGSDPVRPPPTRVGVFRLVAPIATGGMGEVWRAERDDGLFEQVVAVKLIRQGIAGALSAGRFVEERRLLARIEHPNVARVIDGGVTPDGRAWLATEYVAGVAIDADAEGRSTAETVRILLQAARAVQFSHGRLIAHGDIKPANILVDTHGQPRLVDFGVAGLIASDNGHVPGAFTPTFASPERVAGGPPSVADDVFALGRTLAVLTGSSHDRELSAIVGRATAAAAVRYATAGALIDDLERWLDGRAVAAMGGGLAYRARKFVMRNRIAVGLAIVALVLLALAGTVAERNYVRAQQARDAEAIRFADAHRAARYLMFDLLDRLEHRPGTLRLRVQVGAVAQRYLDRLAATPDAPPGVRLDVARGYLRMATISGMGNAPNLADVDRAARDLDRAVAMLDELRRERPRWPELWEPMARSLSLSCQNKIYGSQHDAIAATRVADRGLAELAAAIPNPADRARIGWQLRVCRADALVWLNRTGEAIASLETDLSAGLARSPVDETMVERTLRILGEAYFYAGRYPDAERVLLRAAAIQAAVHAREPFYGPAVIEAANVADDLASTYGEQHRFADQARVAQAALALVEAQAALDPDDLQSARRALSMMRLVAGARADSGDPEGAVALMAVANDRWRALQRRTPNDATTARLRLLALSITGDLQRKANDVAAACRTYAAAASGWADFARRWRLSPSDAKEDVAPVRRNLSACGGGRGGFVDG